MTLPDELPTFRRDESQPNTEPVIWTRMRQELLTWFNDNAPSFADGYRGAVQLLHTPGFPGRVHFVCHAIRDIYRLLPESLGEEPIPNPGARIGNMVQALVRKCDKSPFGPNGSAPFDGSHYLVTPRIYEYVKKIVNTSRSMPTKKMIGTNLAASLYGTLERRVGAHLEPRIIDAFDEEYDFFVDRAHLSKTADGIPSDAGLLEHFLSFERAFHALVGPYFTGKEELDEILEDTNRSAS